MGAVWYSGSKNEIVSLYIKKKTLPILGMRLKKA